MERSHQRTQAGKAPWKVLAVLATLTLLVAVPLAAGTNTESGRGLISALMAAQSEPPEPIVLETLTDRAVFTDDVAFDLTIGLQGSEPITMNVTAPGRSVIGRITIQPGARFPWHTHPGPIFVNVTEGELVYIPASGCVERHYSAGTTFVDPGRGNAHTAYNASEGVTILMATFFEVPEEGPLTITEGVVAPEGCDVEVGVHQH